MGWKNTSEAYGRAAKLFHWIMAALVIGLLAAGLYMVGMDRVSPDRVKLYGLHKSFGALVLAVVAARLAWRLTNTVPPLPDDMRKIDKFGAHAAHWGLYALMFAMPLSGWAMSAAAGFPPSFFGLFTLPNIVPVDDGIRVFAKASHWWLSRALIVLIALHAGAALWHHFIRKDNILRRML